MGAIGDEVTDKQAKMFARIAVRVAECLIAAIASKDKLIDPMNEAYLIAGEFYVEEEGEF